LEVQVIAPSLTLEIIRSDILEPLLALAKDAIPNIRFNVAKSLEVLAATFSKAPDGLDLVQNKIVPVLEAMKNDSDADVRYFAARALQKGVGASGMVDPFFSDSIDTDSHFSIA
jgi:serine/threonine-protein phosphatase 2A regulatory subunit A